MQTSTFKTSSVIRTSVLIFFCLCFSVRSFGLIVISNAPSFVSASVVSSTSAKVNFVAPNSTGSGTINYTVTSSPGNKTATGTATGITVTGLTTNTTYTFTVRAVGDGGGDFTSTASNSITPKTINTITWSGSTSTNWGTASNWTGGVLPGINDKVSIPTGKTVVIAVGSTISVNSVTIAGTGKLTNNGTLSVITQNSDNAITFSSATTASFDNEGTLTLNTSAGFNNVIGIGGTAGLVFNGTVNIVAGASKSVISASASSTTTLSGTGFTIGSSSAEVNYGLVTATSTSASIIISSGTTLSAYINANNVFYLSSSASVTNNGTINTYTSTTGTSLHALQIWQTTSALTATFTNNGTFLMSGFEQPTVFGGSNTGSTGYCRFENKVNSTTTIIYNGLSGSSLGISSISNLPNVYINSGTINLNVSYRAISLNAKSAGGSFTNTGTVNITKGNISSSGTVGTASTYQTIDNNSGGVINFNYGIPSGTTNAANAVTINNNSGGTINGSCTFAASTLITNAGSTLSPGDYNLGTNTSGIGRMILTPSSTGTKFPLLGTLKVQINGRTTPATDYDQLQCTEIDVTSDTLSAAINYTPSVYDYVGVVSATTAKTGPFKNSDLPNGWTVDNSSSNYIGIKYGQAVNDPGAGDGSLTDTNIQYIGRWDKSNVQTYQSHWGGAYLRVKFTGTSISIKLSSSAAILVMIDGETPRAVSAIAGVTQLNISTLSSGVHTLIVGSSSQNTEVSFMGLILDPGAVTFRDVSKLLIDYIGDSITAGTGPTGTSIVNYAWSTAELLGCDHTQIAFSGLSLSTGYGCLTNKVGLDSLYFLFKNYNHLTEIPLKVWDYSYTPNVVYMALGTNDVCGSEPEATFYTHASTFLQRLRAQYPLATLVVQRPLNGSYATPLSQLVTAMNNSGDSKVYYINTQGWLDAADFSDGTHPNAQGTVKYINNLYPILQPIINGITTVTNTKITSSFNISPNPIIDIMQIKADKPLKKISLYNLCGELLESFNCNQSSISLNINHLKCGVYLVKIISEDGLYRIQKVIKK